MKAEVSQVAHTKDENAILPIPSEKVYHRLLPELFGEGSSVLEAGEHLLNLLDRARASVSGAWRRDHLDRVEADVREFIKCQQATETVECVRDPSTVEAVH